LRPWRAAAPQLVVHGDADKTVPVANSRQMESAKKLNVEINYLEIPGGNHVGVFIPAVPEMFVWFDAHRKQSTDQP
jgi:dipeptidyl aminopeptidase/acylaminoacyl peptidase